jgi:hypothetical protein
MPYQPVAPVQNVKFLVASCDKSHYCPFMDTQNTLIAEIEAAAAMLGLSPSTVGERAGQGGRFYARLKSGARVWPETEAKVRQWIATASLSGTCDPSHADIQDAQKYSKRGAQ